MRPGAAALAFLAVAALAGVAACGSRQSAGLPPALPYAQRPDAAKSKIAHVVIVIQENRSFDNFFATFPGADGTRVGKAAAMPPSIVSGCKHPITKATSIPLQEVSLVGNGSDLDHIHTGYLTDLDHGKMDGFDLLG